MRDGYVVSWQGREYDAAPDGDNVRIYQAQPGDGFEEVKPGRQRLQVAILSPLTGRPAIRLAIEGRQPDGWYDVGAVDIASRP